MNLNWRYFYQKVRRTWYGRGERNSVRERTGVNFTNVLRAAFMYVSCARSFLCLHFSFVLYWRKPTVAKAAPRTLMKLSPDDWRFAANIFAMLHFQFETRAGITEDLPFTSFIRPPPFHSSPLFLHLLLFCCRIKGKTLEGEKVGYDWRELEGSWEKP